MYLLLPETFILKPLNNLDYQCNINGCLILNLYQGHFGVNPLSLQLSMVSYWITKLLNLAGQIFMKVKVNFLQVVDYDVEEKNWFLVLK